MLSVTFNNNSVISWQSVLQVVKNRVHRENHRQHKFHDKKLYPVQLVMGGDHMNNFFVVIDSDCIDRCISNVVTTSHIYMCSFVKKKKFHHHNIISTLILYSVKNLNFLYTSCIKFTSEKYCFVRNKIFFTWS
jgi:hypothetical protein